MTRIVRTRDTCGGRPRIEGTRVTTDTIYQTWHANGLEFVQMGWPHLTAEQIDAALNYELRWYRRLRRWAAWSSWVPEFEGTVTWRGRTWLL